MDRGVDRTDRSRRYARGPSARVSPGRRVHDRGARRVRVPARHGARDLRGIPQRRTRSATTSSRRGSPHTASGSRCRRSTSPKWSCPGTNAVGALLSDGWWRGQHGIVRAIDAYGTTTAFLAELHVALRTGERIVFGTDESWRSTPSHILAADLICGEIHDHRRRVTGWCRTGDRSDRGWDAVRVADHGYDGVVSPTIGPPGPAHRRARGRVDHRDSHRIVTSSTSGRTATVGYGSHLGPAGTKLTITYGEWLNPDGDVTRTNIEHGAFAAPARSSAAVPDRRRHLGRRRRGLRAAS